MQEKTILSPCFGYIQKIEKFPDEIIADKVIGDGFCVELSENEIVAPFDGEVKVVYPTGHALCLESNDGIQIMIHIGADTYAIKDLNKTLVSVNQKVKKGDLLVNSDVKKLKKKTGNSFVAIVFLNNETVKTINDNRKIEKLQEAVTIQVKTDD